MPIFAPFPAFVPMVSNGSVGWKKRHSRFYPPMIPRLQSGHSLPEANTLDAALISVLPLVGRQAEEYPLR